MKKKLALALAAGSLAAAFAAPAPASATSHDCVILGPDYVDEVVDCAVYIIERAIQW